MQRFQPGEGPSRGLLRDCTTAPINRQRLLSIVYTIQVGLETVREEQLSLLLSDGAVRRLIRGGDRLHYKVEIEDTV